MTLCGLMDFISKLNSPFHASKESEWSFIFINWVNIAVASPGDQEGECQ